MTDRLQPKASAAQKSQGHASTTQSSAAAEPHWSAIGEKTSCTGIRTLLFIAKHFGLTPFRWALKPVLLFYWLTNARLRRDVLDYQRRVGKAIAATAADNETLKSDQAKLAGLLSKPGTRTGLLHLERFAETILDKIIAASGHNLEKRQLFLDVIGNEWFDADAPNQGAVILTSHAGCQELLSREAKFHTGHALVVLEHTGHARRFNEMLERAGRHGETSEQNTDSASYASSSASTPKPRCEFFEVGALSPSLAMALAERVENGAYLILAGDRTPIGSEKAVASVPFMGDNALFPTGGALLALLLKCPLRMMTCTRTASHPDDPTGSARYRVHFESLDEKPAASRREREAYLQRMAATYAQSLQREIVASPFDWFNFFDFWRSAPKAAEQPIKPQK